MKKYYLMAIEHGNHIAMYNLGNYYKNIEYNEELINKYFSLYLERCAF
jgi:TPR repeat protein